jgi:hypothetical protein
VEWCCGISAPPLRRHCRRQSPAAGRC